MAKTSLKRDKGAPVVSSAAGYKLPCSVRDIYSFFNYYNQQIQPMLHRLGRATVPWRWPPGEGWTCWGRLSTPA